MNWCCCPIAVIERQSGKYLNEVESASAPTAPAGCIHCCSGEPDEIVSIDLIDFEPKEQPSTVPA
jgi:hypothetical protein